MGLPLAGTEVEIMQPTLCTRCKKRVAVVFISKIEKGETVNEGLCLKCAKELGLPQVNEMMRRIRNTAADLGHPGRPPPAD